MKLKVTFNDGRDPIDLNAGPAAQVQLERQYQLGMVEMCDPEGRLKNFEYTYYLGYAALHVAGLIPQDTEFDAFLRQIEDVDHVAADEPARPTKKAQSRAASAR